MDFKKVVFTVELVMLVAAPVWAQSVGSEVGGDINQEWRIEQGLKSGEHSTSEAGRLERGETRIDKMESKTLRDGNLSPEEATRIQRAQNKESRAIRELKHNDVSGNPNSASQRMEYYAQRNINQQRRIEHHSIQSGQIKNKEASQLERGQSRVNRIGAGSGADRHVNKHEQGRIQHRENMPSEHIFRDKHK